MRRGILLTLLLAVIAFTSLGMWGDILEAGPALKGFPWYLLPLIAVFGFCNDLVKFLRWHLYLLKMDIRIPVVKSLNIFIAGLSMSATPGKVGFLIKSQMLKNIAGRTLIGNSPVIIAELYMDFISLSLISLLGLRFVHAQGWLVVILGVIPLLGLIPAVPRTLVRLISGISLFSRKGEEFQWALDDMFKLFGPRVLVASLVVTVIAWTSEGVALSLILKGLGFHMGVMEATVIFGFSTLIGALSLLPGGLVVTDYSLMGLMVQAGVPNTPSALAAIMGRLFTLWLAVCIGSIFLFANRADVWGQAPGREPASLKHERP